MNSEYQKTPNGASTLFEVTPAQAPKFVLAIVIGVFALVNAIGCFGLGIYIVLAPPSVLPETGRGSISLICFGVGLVLGFFAWLFLWIGFRDTRPRSHRSKVVFRVAPNFIESNGRTFDPQNIHRLIIKNGITGSTVSTISLGSAAFNAGAASSAAHRERMYAIANALDLESGGKAYTLAGGMDETTAFGLLKDVSKIIGFQN